MSTKETLEQRDDWIARLTDIAYRAVLRQGYRGSFLDLELALWREVQGMVERTWPRDSDGACVIPSQVSHTDGSAFRFESTEAERLVSQARI